MYVQKHNKSHLGTAVQLRIVETIALDIVVTFRRIFLRVEFAGNKIFSGKDDLAWINSHIKAEAIHHHQVSDETNGIANIACNTNEQKELLLLMQDYLSHWANVFSEFKNYIQLDKSSNVNQQG